MQSLIASHLKPFKKAVEIYCDLLAKYNKPYKEPHDFVKGMMDVYNNLDKKPDRSVHGRYFEYVIGETLAQQGIRHLYYQAEVLHVPLATFDWFLYHETSPVSVSCKTKARDRWKQAAYEAMALKKVYVQATNYLVTMEELSATDNKKTSAPQTIDYFLVATKSEYSEALEDIAKQRYAEAVKTSPIVKGKLLSIE